MMRYVIVLIAVLATIYAQAISELVDRAPKQTLLASSEVTSPKLKPSEMVEAQLRNKRAPILLGKALLGGAILGKGIGALGVGALGVGALGVGALGAGVLGAGLYKTG